MTTDRYLRVILTIIAIELAWIGLEHAARPASAQTAATPVVITGIEMRGEPSYLPVAVVGGFRQIPAAMRQTVQPLVTKVEADRPLRIDSAVPLRVDVVSPITVDTERPLKVESVPYTPGQRPGE
jgi:hypothetical protein